VSRERPLRVGFGSTPLDRAAATMVIRRTFGFGQLRPSEGPLTPESERRPPKSQRTIERRRRVLQPLMIIVTVRDIHSC
jgi:hypothetical protein